MAVPVPVSLELGGGLELLFGKVKKFELSVPVGEAGGALASPPVPAPLTLAKLILWARDNVLTERPDLFVVGDTL